MAESSSKTFGYMRVSTKEQNEGRQLRELLEYGIDERDIFLDKQSGRNFDRKNYQLLRNQALRRGDILVIKSIDRFGRNYQEIYEEWTHITKVIGADIVVLDMPLLNTTQHKDLLGTLITDIVSALLSYVAQNTRETIKQAQREGIAVAKADGIKFGRPVRQLPEQWDELYQKWKTGKIMAVDMYRQLGISKSTFYKLVKSYVLTKVDERRSDSASC